MTTQTKERPKQRIDSAEIRLSALERELSILRRDNQKLQQITFAQSNRIAELENYQTNLRNIMARMTQKMEMIADDYRSGTSHRNRPVCSLDSDKLRMDSKQADDTLASVGQSL